MSSKFQTNKTTSLRATRLFSNLKSNPMYAMEGIHCSSFPGPVFCQLSLLTGKLREVLHFQDLCYLLHSEETMPQPTHIPYKIIKAGRRAVILRKPIFTPLFADHLFPTFSNGPEYWEQQLSFTQNPKSNTILSLLLFPNSFRSLSLSYLVFPLFPPLPFYAKSQSSSHSRSDLQFSTSFCSAYSRKSDNQSIMLTKTRSFVDEKAVKLLHETTSIPLM